MALEQMYKGIPFSPTATLTANISATDTIIPVSDVDAFPDAPNIATIGSTVGPNETIIYTGKTTTSLTGCTRGVEGAASDWMTDELIGRNFTAKDHADIIKNIEELESNKLDASYKVDVVNTADVTIAGKALDAKQNNPNITGTLAQKVDSNTQQINVLNDNGFNGKGCSFDVTELVDMHTFTKVGTFHSVANFANVENLPDALSKSVTRFTIKNYYEDDRNLFLAQEIWCYDGANVGVAYKNTRISTTWKPWFKIGG